MTDFKYESKDLEIMNSAQNYHDWIIDEFKEFLGENVAEVGAGIGNFSTFILKNPTVKNLVAIEPDKKLCAMFPTYMPNPKAKIVNGFFNDIAADYQKNFDSVVYVNVLEHVENDLKELNQVHSTLKKGGTVCIFVPALPFLYSDHDKNIGHFRRYTKKKLKKLLEETGFKIEKIKYMDILGIITWMVVFKILKKEPGSGNISFYDRFITPILRLLENLISPPIGKSLIAVGRKIDNI